MSDYLRVVFGLAFQQGLKLWASGLAKMVRIPIRLFVPVCPFAAYTRADFGKLWESLMDADDPNQLVPLIIGTLGTEMTDLPVCLLITKATNVWPSALTDRN